FGRRVADEQRLVTQVVGQVAGIDAAAAQTPADTLRGTGLAGHPVLGADRHARGGAAAVDGVLHALLHRAQVRGVVADGGRFGGVHGAPGLVEPVATSG